MAHPLTWHPPTDANPRYHRPFEGLEKYEYYMSTMNPKNPQRAVIIGVTFPSTSSTPYPVESVKSAWRQLRYAHPVLGCKITPKGYEFSIKSSEEIDEWVESTVKIVDSEQLQDEFKKEEEEESPLKQFSCNLPYPDTAELYYSPPTNSLFLQLRHEIIDGIGSLMLLNNFLQYLFSPNTTQTPPKDNPTLLSPSISEITNSAPPTPEILQKNAELVKTYFSTPTISLRLNPTLPQTPSSSNRQEYTLSTSQSSKILQSCKHHGITITHAVTASVALSILALTNQNTGTFSTTFPTSLRDTLPYPYNTPSHAALMCITSPLPIIPVVVPGTTLVSLAKAVKKVYSDWKYDKDNIRYHGPQVEMFEQAMAAGLAPSNSAGKATVVVSSLGIVERYLTVSDSNNNNLVNGGIEEEGEGRIKDFWMGQVQGSSKIVVFLYTFAGKIRLATCYNSGFHEDGAVGEFIEVVVKTLYKGLGVDGIY
ncbi:hypothetical protein TWF718_005674 [Orbilia javanica]|uniref:Uncharacterized protein n=1 Tax=Orbilia javanica TaxID=47235 RepID=A0AAN8MQ97_9PEZI